MSTVAGPGPVARNGATAAFFDGTARGELLLMRCRPHHHWNRPQAERCATCDSTELEPAPASGRARLVSWSVVHPRPRDGVAPGPPSVPAIVEMEEGPWWWTQLVDVDPATLRDGEELEVVFERPEGSESVPVFTPAQGR
jgi:uncharacterized OB-fold protein